jgi:hypothetical protein
MDDFRRTIGLIVVKIDARAMGRPPHIIANTIYPRLKGRDGSFEADNPE